MKLNKYSESKDGSTVIGSFSDRRSTSSSNSSGSSSTGAADRYIWGQEDTGDDIDGDMTVSGNIYIGDVAYDDDENPIPPDHEFPSDDGNLYASSSMASPEVYGKNIFIDIAGIKTSLLDILMPVGSVIMFDGRSEIPNNWAICDGKNGTPDLMDKFIKGVTDKKDVGKTGGTSSVDLSANVPAHTHKFYNYLTQVHGNGEIYDNESILINNKEVSVGKHQRSNNPTCRAQTEDSGFSDIPYIYHETESTGVEGEANAIEIEPPYFTLIYIMRVK